MATLQSMCPALISRDIYEHTPHLRLQIAQNNIIFEACYLLKLGLNVEAEIQILNGIYPLLPYLKTAK